MRKKTERRRLNLNLPIPIWDKLGEIQNTLGLSGYADVVQYAIIQTHKKECDNYVNVIKSRSSRINSTDPTERAKAKIESARAEKEAKDQLIHEEGLRICSLLDGNVIENNGLYACEFNTYEIVNPNYATKGLLTVPFEQLSESHAINQVRPTGKTRDEAIKILNEME